VAGLKSVIMLPREADCAAPVMAANAKATAVPVSHCFDTILVLRLPLQIPDSARKHLVWLALNLWPSRLSIQNNPQVRAENYRKPASFL